MIKKRQNLAKHIKQLYQKGKIGVSNEAILNELKMSKPALNQALNRLKEKREIFTPVKGFHTIVPLEYQDRGYLPPDQFIHSLMKYLHQPYYVSLLTAARYHGVSYQAPQVFQVMTDHSRSEIKKLGVWIQFVSSRSIEKAQTQEFKTTTGFIQISTPAQTMFDLVRFYQASGGLNLVAGVVCGLAKHVSRSQLKAVLGFVEESAHARRLGYLLEKYADAPLLVDEIQKDLKRRPPITSYTPLMPGKTTRGATKDSAWGVWVNYALELE